MLSSRSFCGGSLGVVFDRGLIITAQGKLITTKSNIVVQPLETSVIREISLRSEI